ncbi:MAG: cytochrome c [Chloroflexales bacterium]|nr:cytochrome c [Chloroflexales bacterium]
MALGELQIPAEQIDHAAPFVAAPPAARTPAFGRHLVTMGNCADCHGAALSGAPSIEPGAPPAPNLTPGGVLGGRSETQFLTALRTAATPSGHSLSSAMPWQLTGQLTDEELGAIFAYLQSLPPRAYNSDQPLATSEANTIRQGGNP